MFNNEDHKNKIRNIRRKKELELFEMYWGYFYKSENDTILRSILVSKNAYDKLCELLVRYKNDTDGYFKYACKN